jgi:hypothetical protein
MPAEREEELFRIQQALDPVLPPLKFSTLRVQVREEGGRWYLKVGNLTGHDEDDLWHLEWEGDSFLDLLGQIEEGVGGAGLQP